jgi:hypothetical protein
MPIEIKELHIKIHVDEGASKSENRASSPPAKNADTSVAVEEIMEIIRLKKER